MPKYTVIPGYIDENGQHFVMNTLTTLFEKYNPSKQKMSYNLGIKIAEGPKVYRFNGKANKILLCFPSTPDTTRMTVYKQDNQKIYGRLPDGREEELRYNQINTAIAKGKINCLKIINGMVYIDDDPQSSYFKLKVPDYLKDVVDDNWNILSKSEDITLDNCSNTDSNENSLDKTACNIIENSDDYTDKNEGIQSEISNESKVENSDKTQVSTETKSDNDSTSDTFEKIVQAKMQAELEAKNTEYKEEKKREEVKDIKFKVNNENKNDKLPEMSYLDFYKEVINNSRVGDVLSIPKCLLDDLRVEFIKIIDGSFSGSHQTIISKIKTSNSVSNTSISVIGLQDDSEYCSMQIMSKPLDDNSVSAQDIDVEYYKWKQSRKYVQG